MKLTPLMLLTIGMLGFSFFPIYADSGQSSSQTKAIVKCPIAPKVKEMQGKYCAKGKGDAKNVWLCGDHDPGDRTLCSKETDSFCNSGLMTFGDFKILVCNYSWKKDVGDRKVVTLEALFQPKQKATPLPGEQPGAEIIPIEH